MNFIIKPVTPDGNTGYDEFNQFMTQTLEHNRHTMWPIADVRDKICLICQRGWENTSKSLQNQMHLSKDKWVHESCYVGHLSLNEMIFWRDIFNDLHIRFDMEDIPNQYGYAHDTPWFVIELTDFHKCHFVVGRRKRVWSIELNTKKFENEAALAILEKEDVTTSRQEGRFLIHAWTEEKCKEYVKLLGESINIQPYTREPIGEFVKTSEVTISLGASGE